MIFIVRLYVKEIVLKIVILGVGVLGCVIGVIFIEGGYEIWLIVCLFVYVDVMCCDGLCVDDVCGSC